MSTIYEIIDNLCAENGISGSKMCDDLGMSRSTLTELRKGRAKTLNLEKASKIADYFGVSVDYLLGNEPKEKAPTVEVDDERSAKRKMLFDLFNSMTDEELDAMIAFTNAIQKKIDEKKK